MKTDCLHEHDGTIACDNAKAAAEWAANRAVEKTFKYFGVDVNDPRQVAKFQDDFRFALQTRSRVDKVLMAALGVMGGGLAIALWNGIKAIAAQ